MTPIVNGLEDEFVDRVTFQRIDANVGDGPEIMRQYRIPGHPVILLINQAGTEINRLVGPQSTEVLAQILQDFSGSQ